MKANNVGILELALHTPSFSQNPRHFSLLVSLALFSFCERSQRKRRLDVYQARREERIVKKLGIVFLRNFLISSNKLV